MSGTCLMCQLLQLPSVDCPAMHALLSEGLLSFQKAPAMRMPCCQMPRRLSHASQSLLMDSCPQMTPL